MSLKARQTGVAIARLGDLLRVLCRVEHVVDAFDAAVDQVLPHAATGQCLCDVGDGAGTFSEVGAAEPNELSTPTRCESTTRGSSPPGDRGTADPR